ncbi:MAG TPA: bifunctional methylenetetrahydrofolate dehydrogenase/methenyltetrahydrofolate cyclohydrolase, partial [Firmicutes bacterium]|nr:bifunctional methylenetetrahydrofolate dehydrogenase/methenyltetrahydrofolate cyclohydrolase [Bacillota bacterium]
HKFPKTTTEELLELVKRLNEDEEVTGIILQSPALGIDYDEVAGAINPVKDVDGFTNENISALYYGKEILIPCTVRGIIKILEHYGVDLDGKNVTIVGRGNIVGKPLSLALNNRNATITLCHSHTKSLTECTMNADIVVAAAGSPKLIKGDMVKDGVILVDVGMNKIDGVWYGDVDRESVDEKAGLLTPVPGGVGPMTIAMIMENLIIAKELQNGQKIK